MPIRLTDSIESHANYARGLRGELKENERYHKQDDKVKVAYKFTQQ